MTDIQEPKKIVHFVDWIVETFIKNLYRCYHCGLLYFKYDNVIFEPLPDDLRKMKDHVVFGQNFCRCGNEIIKVTVEEFIRDYEEE